MAPPSAPPGIVQPPPIPSRPPYKNTRNPLSTAPPKLPPLSSTARQLPLPPSTAPVVAPVVPPSLEKQEWYWERSTVPHLGNMLWGKPDGSFLVCGSQKEEKYTLIVRVRGISEIIHIRRYNGKYGFFDSFPPKPALVKFPTIPALVAHFRRVPLTEYKACLNTTLAHPVTRFAKVRMW